MINFIYFDFGAVLVNYDEVFKKVSSDFNLDRDEFKDFYNNFVVDMDVGKESVSGFWKKSVEKFGLKNAFEYNLAKSWVSDYKIIQPVFKMIHSLEGKVDMGIISNIHADVWWAAFEDNWVPKIKYKEILLSSDLGVVKPSRDIYEIAQGKANIKAEEILFIDDKEENLVEPKKMGWKTVLFDQNKAIDGVKKIMELLG
jgi:FMN phosphatase YigB (HAD superfamily)